jgi:hypothetical protein
MNTTEKNIKQALARISRITDEIIELKGMLRASLTTTYCRCGKPTCWCADSRQKGHPSTRLMWSEQSGPKTRAVTGENVNLVAGAVEQYRKYRRLVKKLQAEEVLLDSLLVIFERETTTATRKNLGYQ